MDTQVEYIAQRDSGLGFYPIFSNSDLGAVKEYIASCQSNIEELYRIVKVQTISTVVEEFTVPAHIRTIEEIIEDTISYSTGSLEIEWADGFEPLNAENKQFVATQVHGVLDSCDMCGRFHTAEDLVWHNFSDYCDSCYEDALEEEEEGWEDKEWE